MENNKKNKKKILYVCYRDWAFSLLNLIERPEERNFIGIATYKSEVNPYTYFTFSPFYDVPMYVLTTPDKDLIEVVTRTNPDLILFYGWSWYVPVEILSKVDCICLHPSPLPLYAGGSPIQNQIIAGEKKGAVTLFKMTEKFDAGDIYKSKEISLEGPLSHILNLITCAGARLTSNLLDDFESGTVTYTHQDFSKQTVFKRRKPSESEITIDEIKTKTAEQLYNKIRCLQDPYPTAYLKCADGRKLYIFEAEPEEDKP